MVLGLPWAAYVPDAGYYRAYGMMGSLTLRYAPPSTAVVNTGIDITLPDPNETLRAQVAMLVKNPDAIKPPHMSGY